MHITEKYYVLNILLLGVDILQTIHTVTQASHFVLAFVCFLLIDKKKRKQEQNPRESSRFATPAIRTLKISVFYPKNSQKSQILLLVGSRHTSDDSPTVTQTSLSC